MNLVTISELKKDLIVQFSNDVAVLPEKIQKKIDKYWQSLLDSGKTYTRGEVFTVTQEEEKKGVFHVLVEKTDYAHYLYCQNIDAELGGYGIRVLFTSCLVETLDKKIVIGKMGAHTARAGIFQLAGGGIDSSDIRGDYFDLQGNISKELQEELDINTGDKNRVKEFHLAYLKQGGNTNKIAIVYRMILNETAKEFLEKYEAFAMNLIGENKLPEFDEIVAIEYDKKGIESFLVKNYSACDEYVEPLLRHAYLAR